MRTFGTATVAITAAPYLNEHGRMRMTVDVRQLESGPRYMLAVMISKQRRVLVEDILREIETTGRATISADDCEIGTRMEQEALF